MQRWFFTEDPSNAILRNSGMGDDNSSLDESFQAKYLTKPWLFRVRVPDLRQHEIVCVTGNVDVLGKWQPDKCVPLELADEDTTIWSIQLNIPKNEQVLFRYCVCVIVEAGLQVIVNNWETNLKPRRIDISDEISPSYTDEPHSYGDYDGLVHIDRGWLCKETVIQLKLCNNPLTIWRPKYSNRAVYIKVTPVGLLKHNGNYSRSMSEALEESLSADTQDTGDISKHASTEVASLNGDDPTFKAQSQFGIEYKADDMLIFQSTVLFPANIAFLIDLYIYSSRCDDGEPPHHAGCSYLLPSVMQSSESSVVLPVTSLKHRPLGQIRIDYIVIRPMPNFKCDMSITYARHWKKTRQGLDVGHRGSGSSFKTQDCSEVRENTIASLKNAIDHGADFVEFDVQLSKDLVPIIYHDFHVCISMKKKQLDENDMLELPVKELTFDQLKLLKVYHLSEGKTKNPRFFDEDLEDHQPFPTLQHVLEVLNPHVGFNIEIKWTMQLENGTYELYHPTDLNLYLDTILEVVLRYGGERRIIFSCFNADICSVIRLKQNKYPVMFLTIGESLIYPRYSDPRCWSIKAASQYAIMIEILGINVHTEDLLRDPKLVLLATRAGLIIFCWGDENADPATIKYLKGLGLHGVIYDKIYQYTSKEIKESIFLIEARESQKDLIRMAAANAEALVAASQPNNTPTNLIKEQTLDIEKARETLNNVVSTATSLESLESHLSDYETNNAMIVSSKT